MLTDGADILVGEESGKSNSATSDPVSNLVSTLTDANDDKASDSDGDAAEEILEESPDKRWSKRREKVKQRDVPGIDAAYLAMDNETGNEVVWNEVLFSERKNFRDQEEKIKAVFDNLTQLVHVNLVKFHKYWTDTKSEKPRIIFITEYMSSGSMSRFLQRTRASGTLLNIKAWKKWTTQILSALNYLHQCEPPIVHANLTCNTVFIQQNGLIKIGCVAPNTIHHHVKTFRENFKNMHYVAPELERAGVTQPTTQADIYSFGICALEMAMTGALVGGNGMSATTTGVNCNGIGDSAVPTSASTTSCSVLGPEAIRKSLDALEDSLQRDFIEKCLNPDPEKRPTARELLFHPVLFEVHSLKLIAAHVIVNTKLLDQLGEDDLRVQDKNRVAFESKFKRLTYAELSSHQVDLEKFLEDVKNGIYPLIAFAPLAHAPTTKLHSSPSLPVISNVFSGSTTNDVLTANAASQYHYHDDHHQKTGIDGNDSVHSSPEPNSAVFGSQAQQQSQHKNGYNTITSTGYGGLNDTGQAPNVTSVATIVPSSATNAAILSTIPSAMATLSSVTNEHDEGYHTAPNVPTTIPVNPAERPSESRLIRHMQATVDGSSLQVLLRLDDQMNRQLTTEISDRDTAENLVIELVQHGFISEVDSAKMCSMLDGILSELRKKNPIRQNSPT